MNSVNIIGRWTKDVELSYTPSTGTAVARGTMAVDSRRKDANGEYVADFIPVKAFGKTAELMASSSSGAKGHMMGLSGRLMSGKYQDKKYKDVTHYTLELVVDEVTFTEKKGDNGSPAPAPSPGAGSDDHMTPVDDGDIPF